MVLSKSKYGLGRVTPRVPCVYSLPSSSDKHWVRCSRLKPSYEFHSEGLSNFSPSVERLVQIQDVNPRICRNENTELVLNLCMKCMVHVSNTMRRFKNHPSNSTSCIWQCPTFVGSCAKQSISRTSSDVLIFNLGLRIEGLFWERYILRGQIAFGGHWGLQSWTLIGSHDNEDLAQLRRLYCSEKSTTMPISLYSLIWGFFGLLRQLQI